jgi:hypothetical protein
MTETDEMSLTSDYADFQPVYKQDDYTLASESSEMSEVSPTKKKQRNYMDAYMLNDKSYHKMRRTGGTSDEKVGVYSTCTMPGASIRDAITGASTPMCRVGSIYEDLYFKVCFATGEFGSEPKTMFFDCPEQYERHLNASVSQSIKDRWTSKFASARKLLEGQQ